LIPLLLLISLDTSQSTRSSLLPSGLGAHFAWLVLTGLALVLSGTAAYRRLGTGYCVVAGVLILGMVLWPTEQWEWPFLTLSFGRDVQSAAVLALVVAALLLGGTLLWVGLARERSRVARRLAITTFVALIVLAFVSRVTAINESVTQHDVPQLLVSIWNLLRLELRIYSMALLLVVGALAWIVGARVERDVGSVFD
jgi:hypothetical protein